MGTNCFKSVKLNEIAKIERGKNKPYPKGTIYIQVSACKREGRWEILEEESFLESKHAIVEWKIPINTTYMVEVLNSTVGEWKHKYVGTNINIQMEAFDYYKLMYHTDIKLQNKIAETFEKINFLQKSEEKIIENLKKHKQHKLQRMFPNK